MLAGKAMMSLRQVPALSRYAIIVACVAAVGAIAAGVADGLLDRRAKTMALTSQQCQEDLQVQIAQLQDYLAAKRAEPAAREPADPNAAASLDERWKAMRAFKSRC